MELVRLNASAAPPRPLPALAIGNFDGVHLGHQALVRATVLGARAAGVSAAVLTFEPHPARVVAPERSPRTLLTLEQRAEILAELGVGTVAVLAFDAALAGLSPERFAEDVLARRLLARSVFVGERFRFGSGRAGDAARLMQLGDALGFRVHALPVVSLDGGPVSSSRVREALAQGDVGLAARLLGRPFFVDGRVVSGDGRGRTLGVPTANVETLNETLPGDGVYAGRARPGPGGAWWPCVVNVGLRPTFDGRRRTVEAHLLSFDGELLGSSLRLRFQERLREERRFQGAAELAAQIKSDIEAARRILEQAG
jgi:riboflavin kinase/FMN adenylyltransferase